MLDIKIFCRKMKRSVESPKILIEPSTELVNFVKSLKSNNLSENWSNIRAGKPTAVTNTDKYTEIESFLTSEDIKYLNKIDTDCKISTNDANDEFYNPKNQLVTTEDIIDVYNLIKKDPDPKCYLHELIKGSKIVLPKNPTVPRNVKLEKRCEMLRNRQSNLEYNKMTMNVDCCRPQEASESIGYHLKEINNQFLMIFQILFSVSATFMFGMYGLKLLLDGKWNFNLKGNLKLISLFQKEVGSINFMLGYS